MANVLSFQIAEETLCVILASMESYRQDHGCGSMTLQVSVDLVQDGIGYEIMSSSCDIIVPSGEASPSFEPLEPGQSEPESVPQDMHMPLKHSPPRSIGGLIPVAPTTTTQSAHNLETPL